MEHSRANLVHLKGPSLVFLVADLQDSVHFYEEIGFTPENIGGHMHMNYGDVTFILHEARLKSDIRPSSSVEGGLYFDAFCYTNPEGLRQLHELFISKDVKIVQGPHWSDGWSELTIVDNNGYRIAFGG
ncbi:glyoxalase/bleomycin resistance/dioxygenase family protein [Bacillus sp. FJAT-28004]|uniref:glyoxalase/bleomycin resistance/dioxygenase family protein n=1 Tax=Bacillus sp. FJAT-28004 TaxID=1679165 RepID=UPI0006B50432|nr:glyoxalase/bleomycin resistance/dioxygenase family protein [Bacillus sp. FJAT-28004]